mgnify:CR=1 FL=1|jgi:hypothetical protein
MKATRLKQIIKEEIGRFINLINEKKITPKQVEKVQKDLVVTIDGLKKNFPLYKAAQESGDTKKLEKHRKIALDLTKKKKELEDKLDKAINNLYSDAELELKELDVRKTHGDKRIENPKTGNKIKLRTALKAKKGSDVYSKARKIYNNLKEE